MPRTSIHRPATSKDVERRLWCVEGFAWLHGPGFMGSRAERSFRTWSSAQFRGVVTLFELRRIPAGLPTRSSITYAMWTGAVPCTLDLLRDRIAAMQDATPRVGPIVALGLSPVLGRDARTAARDSPSRLSEPREGRLVFTRLDRREAPSRRLAVWALLNETYYVHCVRGDLTC